MGFWGAEDAPTCAAEGLGAPLCGEQGTPLFVNQHLEPFYTLAVGWRPPGDPTHNDQGSPVVERTPPQVVAMDWGSPRVTMA